VLKFLATLTTGSPALAYLLAEQIPVEQLPVVLGKLQLAYDLFKVIGPDKVQLDLLTLWPLLLDHNDQPDRAAWAFGHAMVEYWSQGLADRRHPPASGALSGAVRHPLNHNSPWLIAEPVRRFNGGVRLKAHPAAPS
jgi:hypothetical protein